jgi:hypothetical protein
VSSAIEHLLDVSDAVIVRLKPLIVCRNLVDAKLCESEAALCHFIARDRRYDF